jgi:hypothetical protein
MQIPYGTALQSSNEPDVDVDDSDLTSQSSFELQLRGHARFADGPDNSASVQQSRLFEAKLGTLGKSLKRATVASISDPQSGPQTTLS